MEGLKLMINQHDYGELLDLFQVSYSNPTRSLAKAIQPQVTSIREDLHATKEGWEIDPRPSTNLPGFRFISPSLLSNLPYESHNEAKIVEALTEIYRLQELLCYFDPGWTSITHAPTPDGHEIDIAECGRLGLAPAVISLMQ